jgi:hypothetical protein
MIYFIQKLEKNKTKIHIFNKSVCLVMYLIIVTQSDPLQFADDKSVIIKVFTQ